MKLIKEIREGTLTVDTDVFLKENGPSKSREGLETMYFECNDIRVSKGMEPLSQRAFVMGVAYILLRDGSKKGYTSSGAQFKPRSIQTTTAIFYVS